MLGLLWACSEYKVESPEPPVTSLPTTTPPTTEPPVVDSTAPVDTGTPPETVPATAPVYANTSDTLYEIAPATGARTYVGKFQDGGAPIEGMVDIAIDTAGRMFGGTYDAIWQIDPTSAAVSKVCDTDLAPYALAFTSDGVLFAGAGADIVRIELPTCNTTTLVSNSDYETSGDLVGLPDGYLYWTVDGGDNDHLVRVDALTGAAFWVGVVDEVDLFGLGYDQGELYGFSRGGAIVRIDPGTASTESVFSDGTSWWGATTNPVVW